MPMRSRFRGRAIGSTLVGIVAACSFNLPKGSPGGGDDQPTPDAGPCQEIGSACAGNTLRVCGAKDVQPTDIACAWGCLDGPPAHCGELTPSGGAVMPVDLRPNGDLLDTTLDGSGTITIDTDDGSIGVSRDGSEVRAPGVGVIQGIDFIERGAIAVFRFRNLAIATTVRIVGARAAALVATDTITVTRRLDVACNDQNVSGPGGFAGGDRGSNGGGTGGGARGAGSKGDCSGGAGGSFGGTGGQGGSSSGQNNTQGGPIYGDALITLLVGGGGGGGGGGSSSDRGSGGGGGGAVQLAANQRIVFADSGSIDAGGCGGGRGSDESCGGGGGAGGAILLEAPLIELSDSTTLAANGGGGGCGSGTNPGTSGLLSQSRAPGGTGDADGGSGGAAGAGNMTGTAGADDSKNGAGGGGGVGWIRLDTRTGAATIGPGVVLSPALGDATSSQGAAVVH